MESTPPVLVLAGDAKPLAPVSSVARTDSGENSRMADDSLTDGLLARRVAAGERQAAAVLIERYQGLVRSFLRKITGRHDLADDFAQETFLRMIRHAGSYDEQHPMARWLLTIARRLTINHVRKADQRVGSTDYQGLNDRTQPPDELAAQADQQQHQRRALDVAMQALSPVQRMVLMMFHHEGQSVEAIGEQLGMPGNTVKSHLHRARAVLRRQLTAEVLEP